MKWEQLDGCPKQQNQWLEWMVEKEVLYWAVGLCLSSKAEIIYRKRLFQAASEN